MQSKTDGAHEGDATQATTGTGATLRADIVHGRTGNKIDCPDPAAAPLGTDEEAAGTPIATHTGEAARSAEASDNRMPPDRLRGRGPFCLGRPDVRVPAEDSRFGEPELPHVVVVGAGFGGLEVAKALAGTRAAVTIIDRQNHHCFQPLLYQVATAALSPADVAWPIRSILSRQPNARVVMAEVTGIDLSSRHVITASMPPLPYDYLVLATGAAHSYFGHEEWAPFAPGLKRVEDATEIRRRLLLAFEKAEVASDAHDREHLLSFIIVGGGPTGVELAGAVAEIARYALARDFRCIDPRASRIVLVEAGPRILPALPEVLSNYARASLERIGVTVRTSTTVMSVDSDGVVAASGDRIAGSTTIWAAGVKASPASAWIKAASDRAGRIKVNPDLSVPDCTNVFAIGDTASVAWKGGTAPGIAPAAKQMGRYVGRLIATRIKGVPAPGAFAYRHCGDLATIGRKSAVVSIGRFHLRGWVAWAFWSVAHIYFLIGTRNRLSVASDWLWEYLTFQRGARLINQPATSPPPAAPPESRRSPREVLNEHLRLRCEGRLDEDLQRNFAEDVVVLTESAHSKGTTRSGDSQPSSGMTHRTPSSNTTRCLWTVRLGICVGTP